MQRPQVSIVIPLPDHREQALGAIRSWLAQDCPPGDFQIVVLSDGAEPDLAASAAALLRPGDRMLTIAGAALHDLYNAGVRAAAADLLLLTEAHVMAEPDCVTQVIARMAVGDVDHAALASGGIDENRLAAQEQTLYEEALQARLAAGWDLCTVRGFVVRRERFERAGGFRSRYGHTAEPLLGAALKHAGARLGYAPDARVAHYNNGNLPHFDAELADFGRDEIRFRAEHPDSPLLVYLGPSPVWDARETYRRGNAAVQLANSLGRAAGALRRLNLKQFARSLEAAVRSVPFIALGPAWLTQRAELHHRFVKIMLALGAVRDEWYYRAFRAYWSSAIRRGRAEAVAEWLLDPANAVAPQRLNEATAPVGFPAAQRGSC